MVDVSSLFSVPWDVAAAADCEQVSLTQVLSESQTEEVLLHHQLSGERCLSYFQSFFELCQLGTAFSLEMFCEYDP